jgi:hypothetical protein
MLEPSLVSRVDALFDHDWSRWRRVVAEAAVFLWILAVATGFRDLVRIGNLAARLGS